MCRRGPYTCCRRRVWLVLRLDNGYVWQPNRFTSMCATCVLRHLLPIVDRDGEPVPVGGAPLVITLRSERGSNVKVQLVDNDDGKSCCTRNVCANPWVYMCADVLHAGTYLAKYNATEAVEHTLTAKLNGLGVLHAHACVFVCLHMCLRVCRAAGNAEDCRGDTWPHDGIWL